MLATSGSGKEPARRRDGWIPTRHTHGGHHRAAGGGGTPRLARRSRTTSASPCARVAAVSVGVVDGVPCLIWTTTRGTGGLDMNGSDHLRRSSSAGDGETHFCPCRTDGLLHGCGGIATLDSLQRSAFVGDDSRSGRTGERRGEVRELRPLFSGPGWRSTTCVKLG